jgi:hypothetical protein
METMTMTETNLWTDVVCDVHDDVVAGSNTDYSQPKPNQVQPQAIGIINQ